MMSAWVMLGALSGGFCTAGKSCSCLAALLRGGHPHFVCPRIAQQIYLVLGLGFLRMLFAESFQHSTLLAVDRYGAGFVNLDLNQL